MSLVALVAGVVVGLMLAESRVSRAHERVLLARGAVQPTGDVYPAMALAYPGAFLLMFAEGAWRAAQADGAAGLDAVSGPAWPISGLLLFAASKALKYWAIGALGDRWTFKVIVEPGRPLVDTGPYRYVTHPNYLAVLGELAGAAMMIEAWIAGLAGLVGFGGLLWMRVRFEDRVLASSRQGSVS